MKKTVITCITAFICVVAICVTTTLGIGVICDANVDAAGKSGTVQTSDNIDASTEEPATDANTGDLVTNSAAQDESATGTAADSTNNSDGSASDTIEGEPNQTNASASNGGSSGANTNKGTSNSNNASASNGGSSTNKGSSKPTTTAEILTYFNTSVNKIKSGAKSGVKNYEKNTQAGSFSLTGTLKTFSSSINGLIEKNMGEKEEDHNRALSKADLKTYLPVENETWSSKLGISNIKSASLTESGGKYIITIKVKDDAASSSTGHNIGNHGKAFSVVMTKTIEDNAGPVKSLLKDLMIGYRNGTIKATIDPATGHVTHINYYYVWILNVSAAGNVVKAPFGIEQDFTINW